MDNDPDNTPNLLYSVHLTNLSQNECLKLFAVENKHKNNDTLYIT